MNIHNFADLLQAARAQATPQRLLLVFAAVELPDDATPAQRAGFDAGEGGALVPVFGVDKNPEEIASFDALVQEAAQWEAEHATGPWRFVFVAALSHSTAQALARQAIEKALQNMVEHIQQGDLGPYIPFDRQGLTVRLAGP